MRIPWWSSGEDSVLSPPRLRVQSLVGDLRYCKSQRLANKREKKIVILVNKLQVYQQTGAKLGTEIKLRSKWSKHRGAERRDCPEAPSVWGVDRWDRESKFSSQCTWQTLPWLPAPWNGTAPTQLWAQYMSFRWSWLLSTFNPLRRPSQTLVQLTILTVPKPCKSYPLSMFNDRRNRGYKKFSTSQGWY